MPNEKRAEDIRSRFGLDEKEPIFFRSGTLSDRAEGEEDNSRGRVLTFSTENPVGRFFGDEVLGHKRSEVRLGRLNDGAPLLFNHDPDRYIGVVESARLSDREGTAVVRFGEGADGEEILRAVRNKEITKVSVGYVVHAMERAGERDGVPSFRVTDWEPLEVSMVTIPADTGAGVRDYDSDMARSYVAKKSGTTEMPDRIEDNTPAPVEAQERTAPVAPAPVAAAPAPAIDMNAERERMLREERERVAGIDVHAQNYPQLRDLAEKAKAEGTSLDAFNALALERITATSNYTQPSNPNEIGLTPTETRRYSFMRALRAMANPQNRKFQEDAAFERECSEAIARTSAQSAQGMFVPIMRDSTSQLQIETRNAENLRDRAGGGYQVPAEVLGTTGRRDLSAGTATDGAELVATDLLAGEFIDVLRNAMVTRAAGARVMADLVGDVAIPRKTSGAVAGWISTEGGAAAQSDPQFDQVTMTAKTLGVYTEMTRQLLLQSSLSMEGLVREDLAAGMGIGMDLASLYGSGSSGQPTGVANTTGINNPTDFAAANPTFAEVIDMETLVAVDNALLGSLAYILPGGMRGALKSTVKDAGSGQFVYMDNEMNGYPAWMSNQVVAGDLFFGNWRDLIIGMWGGLDLIVDPYSNSTSGTVRIVALQSVDVAVRHPVSFSHNNDGA